ncbi:hypothetical protein D018_3823B, partial [Vibrio parahaemolyticus VP2007-007]
FKIIKNFVFLR